MASTTSTTFNKLQHEADLTAGNLQNHLKALETAGYIEAWRSLVELKPRMRYRLTPKGQHALRDYCDQLTATVHNIRTLTSSD